MKPGRVELRIGRVVWHGDGAPDRHALEHALQAALARVLDGRQAEADPGTAARTAAALMPTLLPMLMSAWKPASVERAPESDR